MHVARAVALLLRRGGRRALALAVLSSAACSKSAPSTPSPPLGDVGVAALVEAGLASDDGAALMDPRELSQWAEAKDAEPEELARLARLIGCEGLRERAETPDLRITAARAMQFCPDLSELPWLATLASSGSDEEARAALDSVVELAARPRRPVDPEDADELRSGCTSLLELARAKDRPKERRVIAIRALRMLVDRGCPLRSEIPTDLDAH